MLFFLKSVHIADIDAIDANGVIFSDSDGIEQDEVKCDEYWGFDIKP